MASDNTTLPINNKSEKIIKNPIECDLKMSPDCLKIKTLENKNLWYGTSCRKCREIRKKNRSMEKYKEKYKENELDAEYIKQKKEKAKLYYQKNKEKIQENAKAKRLKQKIENNNS